ncbi:unknown [Sutterella sp. CAG:351]|nr:unknown [Sutterella sp. CAG:351]
MFSRPQSKPAAEPSPFGVSSFKTPSYVPPHQPDPVPVQAASPQRDPSQELVSYLQPILERAISDRLSTVIDAAARSAADAAADRIRSEVLSKIDLIVRDAVEHETSRFLRMRR